MLKKTIKYTDFNGDASEEDFYFHLSKAELVEIEMSHKGGLSNSIQTIVDAEDGKTIMEEFKKIILMAYGKRSADGKRFIKTQEMRDEFVSSDAYSELFMELVTDAAAAANFIQAVIPANMLQEAEKVAAVSQATDMEKPAPRVITRAELIEATPEQYKDITEKLGSGEVVLADEELGGE
jgi:hypothetical protein